MATTQDKREARRETRLAERRARGHGRRRLPVVPLAAAVLGAIVVAYLGVTWSQTQSSAPVAQFAPPAAVQPGFSALLSPPGPGASAPDFTVATLDHGPFTLSQQLGKPTVMFFTASYCEPCIPQMHTLARVQEEVGADKLGVLVLDVDPTEGIEGLRRLKLRTGGSHPFALDAGNRVTLLFGVRALDTKMFVGKDGVLVERVDGIPQSEGQLREMVAKLVGA